ncbi:YezD family protein [Paenibacillus sp. GCM10027627]|uniref:YezD family protein n=1 Tax=unclassified Paenibacillus TaxID=185978 RepID=UPI003625F9C4
MAKPLEVDGVWQERILNQVSGLQYGQVIITVHDGRIVQIDRTERTRFDAASSQKQPPVESPKQSAPRKGASPKGGEGESLRAVR